MLRAKFGALLLCLVSTAWSDTFVEEGATGRGPRLEPSQTNTECKQEKNWPICSDDDWGPKCPSGCRIQGLTNQADKDFAKRIDIIKQQLKDGESNYKSIDITTKETYDFIKDRLVAAQQVDNSYNLVTDSLRRKIDFLKITVSSQVERIKLLQRNVKDQVAEMKRLEVDIDIKLRACKGSCAKSIDYNVDHESYENIKKLVVQLDSTDLRPNSDPLPIMKMRPIKESTVPPHYKALTLQKEQFPLFHDIEQYSFVLEGKSKEVTMCPTGCRVQGLITKFGKEIVSRMEAAKQSCVTSNTQHKISISELKQLHQAAERNMLTDKETLKSFAQTGNELRRKLNFLKLKIKEQAIQIETLHRELEDQITAMRIMEVDIEIKLRSCKGSCRDVNFHMTNLDDYVTWKKALDTIKHLKVTEDKNIRYVNLNSVPKNVTSFAELRPMMKEEKLGLFENIEQYSLTLADNYEETDNAV